MTEYLKIETRVPTFLNQPVAIGWKLSETDPMLWEPIPDQINELNKQLTIYAEGRQTLSSGTRNFTKTTGRKMTIVVFRRLAIKFGICKPTENDLKKKSAKARAVKSKKEIDKKIAAYSQRLNTLKRKREEAKVSTDLFSDTKSKIITDSTLTSLPKTAQDDIRGQNIIFEANPGPQTDFLAASEREVFYGGARGGGKSYSLIVDPLRYCTFEAHRALILRRTMPELRDLINHSHKLYKKAFPYAQWREQEKEWRFPSGARIEFGYAESGQDVLRYQGQSYTYIGVDELPQFPDASIWNDLRGALRSVDPNIPEYMRATGNPGNVGSAWVKEMFIDPAPPNTTFAIPIELPDGTTEHITRRFIPAKLKDNPYLTRTKSYQTMLASLPEIRRRQWLDGSWDEQEGRAFPDFDRKIHVESPYELEKHMVRFRACDWGFSTPACVLWFAVDHNNDLIVYREYYGKGLVADTFAEKILNMEYGENIKYGIMDVSAWSKRGDIGPAVPEIMGRNGLKFRPSDRSPGSRNSGKYEIHRRLAIDPITKKPRLRIFNNCTQLIKQLSVIMADPNDPEDCDTKLEDHAIDALRYGVMSRPMNVNSMDVIVARSKQEFQPVDKFFGY